MVNLLDDYDHRLRLAADLVGYRSTDVDLPAIPEPYIQNIGGCRVAVDGDRALITHPAFGDDLTQQQLTIAVRQLLHQVCELIGPGEISWRTRNHDQLDPACVLPELGFQAASSETTLLGTLAQLRELNAPAEIRVRTAGEDGKLLTDLAEFARIHAATLGPTAGLDALAAAIEAGQAAVCLAFVEDQVASVGRIDLIDDDCGYLFGSGTLPHFRGRGAYRAQLASRIAWAAQHGAKLVLTDARAASRPTLTKVGLQPITETTTWVTTVGIVQRRLAAR